MEIVCWARVILFGRCLVVCRRDYWPIGWVVMY